MVLQNKLGITESAKLAREEERISKIKAIEQFNKNILVDKKVGTFNTLSYIHEFLFSDIYEFAGEIRTENIVKDNFRFAPVMFLSVALNNIDKMPQNTFEQIIEKYVEMNIAHPFCEGNGRSMRLWLDHILKSELGKVVDWNKVDKEDYLLAMKGSPIRDIEIKHVLGSALTSKVDSREIFIKGLDTSYYYEGYTTFNAEDLDINNN